VSRGVGGAAFTYVFRFGHSDIWKVGWTDDVETRLREMNRHIPIERTREHWLRQFAFEHPDREAAFAMEQRLLHLLGDHRTEGERVRCGEPMLQAAWDRVTAKEALAAEVAKD
jgi:predicted GIY-YIG superfamily endonuclease